MAALYSRRITMRCWFEEVEVAAVIDTWYESFRALMDTMLADGLTRAVAAAERLEDMTRMSAFVVEGLLTRPLPRAEERKVIEMIHRPR